MVVAAANETAIRVYLESGFVEAERFELHAGTESLLLTSRPLLHMPSLSDTLAVGIGACAVALVATPLAMRLARRVQFVDTPGPLKPQASATPYLGGVAIALGLVVGTVAYQAAPAHPARHGPRHRNGR